MRVGLNYDDVYDTEKLNLFKFNDILFPDENYYNTNYFPREWMELFDDKDNIVERNT